MTQVERTGQVERGSWNSGGRVQGENLGSEQGNRNGDCGGRNEVGGFLYLADLLALVLSRLE